MKKKKLQNDACGARKCSVGCVIRRCLLVLLTTLLAVAALAFCALKMICSDISVSAKQMFVTTLLETGQLKFLASWFVDDDEITALVNSNSMRPMEQTIDDSKITIDRTGVEVQNSSEEKGNIEIVEVPGKTFYGTLMIVHDPASVRLATIYPWRDEGETLDSIVKSSGAVAGINGGLYQSYNNSGGAPYGVVVSGGEIQNNDPQGFPGLVLIGLTEDDILQIVDMSDMTPQDVENMVAEKKIRDAVTFQEEASDRNNHFVQLIINGQPREMSGMGSGLNPRTAIGQRADGSLLLLVTDGRGSSGHLGASASDLIDVMMQYGAVNAANLDGGSSSCMYYEDAYLMTSVTFYYSNSSWKLPFAFVVDRK